MVNSRLLMNFDRIRNKGPNKIQLSDFLTILSFIKEVGSKEEDLKIELEEVIISIQFIIPDISEKFWLNIVNGKIVYNTGITESPSITITTKRIILGGILLGEIDLTAAFMAGDITIEGKLEDALLLQEVIELVLKIFEKMKFYQPPSEGTGIAKYIRKIENIEMAQIRLNQEALIGIEVSNLIFENHYKIDLIRNKIPISILHGLNGCGKTTFLRLIFYLLTASYSLALKIKFSNIKFIFKNNLVLSFNNEGEKKLSADLILQKNKKLSFPLNKKELDLMLLTPPEVLELFKVSPYWNSIEFNGEFPFINLRSKEIVDSMRKGYSYIKRFPQEFNVKYFFNPLIDNNLMRLNIYFVQTNRLESIESLVIGFFQDEAYDMTSETFQPTYKKQLSSQIPLKLIQNDLKQRIEEITEISNSISRKFDSEFFDLLLKKIKKDSGVKISRTLIQKIREDLDKIYDLEQDLRELGLYEFPVDEEKRAQQILQEEHETISKLYDALVVFNEGLKKKLEVFDDLKKKVRLFNDFITSRFRGKRLKVSRQKGFHFITTDNILIEPWELSSGEQHLILLSYFLIFMVKPKSLILIDEPEISLHLTWQRAFIKDVLKLSEELQPRFIIATHSPAIIGDYDGQMVRMHVK